jgi:hypothetical protein
MTLPINKNLEELFDIAPSSVATQDSELTVSLTDGINSLPEAMRELDKIELALPAVQDLAASDLEMDTLANKAQESFDDLMSLGMQVDSRYASEIFAVAGTMMGHAITAKTAKINKKLKMIDLQLKKAKLDQDKNKDNENDNVPTAQGRVLSRNDLLRTLMDRGDENSNADK